MAYSTQQDLEQRIGLTLLTQLMNDVWQVSAPASPSANAAAGGSLADDTYYYVVSAVSEKGETVQSSEVNATTSGSNNSVTVAWSAVSQARAYRVYRSLTTDTYATPCLVAQTTAVTYTDTGAVSPLLAGAPTDDAWSPNAGNVAAVIANADTLIDAKLGMVYTVPFTTVPSIIRDLSVDIACYTAFQRRSLNQDMPKMWQKIYDDAMKMLDSIAEMTIRLPDTATVASASAAIDGSRGAEIDFNDATSNLYNY